MKDQFTRLALVLCPALLLAACSQGSPTAPAATAYTAQSSCPAWNASTAYTAGSTVVYSSVFYTANWWTQGDTPSTHNGASGSGQPWTISSSCGTGTGGTSSGGTSTGGTSSGGTSTTPTPPANALMFGPYKDVTINMDWNTNVISTLVPGTRQPVATATPSKVQTITWAFATGECGSENWGGVQGAALASANVQAFVNAGRRYILSTGGAAGSFTCGSDAGFSSFINRYKSANLVGVDFDIEAGQSTDVINNLVQRVKTAKSSFPNLRYSFTLATLGGNSAQSLGSIGVTTMQAIKNAGLTGYIVNLMVMDYGSANASNCTLNSSGKCDMGKSATQAAINLHNYYGVPYSQIELTPMIGGNDTQDEVFTPTDVATVATFVKQNGLSGVHFWSLDRDTDCAPGSASPTCNSYGQTGNWGFTNTFVSKLGL